MVKSEHLQVVLRERSVFITTLKGPWAYEFVILKLDMVDTATCKSSSKNLWLPHFDKGIMLAT